MRSLGTCAIAALLAVCSGAAEEPLFFRWELGDAADLDSARPAFFTSADRIGNPGIDGATKYRELKPEVYQCPWVMPAFDFDPANHGAINHVFYLTIRFKDVAGSGSTIWAGKGGDGFYGKGYVGTFGGAADGLWKEETLIIPRSMMRCMDGKTFTFSVNGISAPIPVASMLLFSSAADGLDRKAEIIAGAYDNDSGKRETLRAKLLGNFKDLGLPDPGPCPEYAAAENTRGFRVFFPPIHRQLFANSQPREGELRDTCILRACPGEFESLLIAVRALKDLGQLTLVLSDLKLKRNTVLLSQVPVLWARYSEQRIGSSWGKDYRVCPERLTRGAPTARPEQLEIACVTFKVPDDAPPGQYTGTLSISTANAGKAAVPVSLTVYPFKLEHPDHATHGLFYYIDYGDYSPFELEDMRNHGMDTIVAGLLPPMSNGENNTVKMDLEPIHKAFAAMKKRGFRSPIICNSGSLMGLAARYAQVQKGSDEHRRAYASVIEAVKKTAEAEGFSDTGFFPVDEPHTDELIADSKVACTWTRDVPGTKTYITSNPKAIRILQPVLDYVCYNLVYLKPETIDGVRNANATLMFYCPSMDVDPERNRYRAGFYLSKLGAHSIQLFAYMLFADDPCCDLDGPNRDWNVVFPSLDSVCHDPTLEWEALREGVDDYCYAYTLKVMAERARAKGKTADADEALKVLADVLAPVDIVGENTKSPELTIEANVGLKDTKIDPEKLKRQALQMPGSWYDLSRLKIAEAILRVR